MLVADNRAQFLHQLTELAAQRLSEAQRLSFLAFCEAWLEGFPLEDWHGRQLADAFGAVHACWHFASRRPPDAINTALFNPSFERDGWQSGHTILLLACRDMPFVRDSVRLEMNRRGIPIHVIYSAPMRLRRDDIGELVEVGSCGCDVLHEGMVRETMLYMEISRHTQVEDLNAIELGIADVMAEVRRVVFDFDAMVQRVAEAMERVADNVDESVGNTQEIQAFLQWMSSRHFTFLGFEALEVDYSAAAPKVSQTPGSALGLLRDRSSFGFMDLHREITELSKDELAQRQLSFTRSSVRSRVHRQAYPVYVGVRLFDEQHRVVGEYRFLGLFTSSAYTLPLQKIPWVRRKVEQVMHRAEFDARSHDGHELQRLLEIYPRDELFLATVDELFVTASSVHRIQERRQVRLFVRREFHRKFIYCQVFIPRDIYRTEVRRKIEQILADAFGAVDSEFTTYFSESILARTNFVFRVNPTHEFGWDTPKLEALIADATQRWEDRLEQVLIEDLGEEAGSSAIGDYREAFNAGYQADFEPRLAVSDIRKIACLEGGAPIAMTFYRALEDQKNSVRFRVFHPRSALALSDMLPILENLGLRVLSERPHCVRPRGRDAVWIHEFALQYVLADEIDVDAVREPFLDAFERIWRGEVDNDVFNRLILGTQMNWREIFVLRAYARYMKQLKYNFSEGYIADTLGRHLELTCGIIELFMLRFDPGAAVDDAERVAKKTLKRTELARGLDQVSNLSEDQVLRYFIALVDNTLRTNFYQRGADGRPKSYVSFKFAPRQLPDVPEPRPLFEIFVYSPRVEGVHLRGGKVARGGIRWSDRHEDFRTEVLGLVKAQQVKNSVIVPVGAKGGFIVKCPPREGGREALQQEGIACYRTFISGLLDLTDNIVNGQVIPPADVIRKDPDDTYLVVAADKGTATFSDIANALALEYGFWLGDAFASGGSVGYDHKKMGITAKGAWVSVVRHFRDLGLDPELQPFSCVGIGDMSGDVFGNGMLRSKTMCLLGAFDHRHIFVDPSPDPMRSFDERQRMFALPRSSWADYDPTLISAGGGVFDRGAKSISITPEMKQAFSIEVDQLTPNQLIQAMLRAPVDLIWNGGIGTYIKSSRESNSDVGDKTNDLVRINGDELRCRVVGEGGNLGMTQLGRVEYALKGGRCNTDFIDNAGGVDCSDHEVNIKILLNSIVMSGDMTEKQRNQLLESMTDDVSELVLTDNFRQVQAISVAEAESAKRLGEYRRLLLSLEDRGKLNRALEYLPDEEGLAERKALGRGLTRPELAVVICYVKGLLKEDLVVPEIYEDEFIAESLAAEFPDVLNQRFATAMASHSLRNEIIATQLANDMVNHMGMTFVHRLQHATGSTPAEIARAYVTSREVFAMHELWRATEKVGFDVPAAAQLQVMTESMRLVRRGARWFLRNRRRGWEPRAEVLHFRHSVQTLKDALPALLAGSAAEERVARSQWLVEQGMPAHIADYVASASALYASLGIAEAAASTGQPLERVAEMFFTLGAKLDLDWFTKQLGEFKVDNYWQALAREAFMDDVEWQQRALTVGVLQAAPETLSVPDVIEQWIQQHSLLVERWRSTVLELQAAEAGEVAMYTVAVRELLDLAQVSTHRGCDYRVPNDRQCQA